MNLLLWLVPSSALHGSAADALQLFNATDATERGPVAAPVASIRYAANRAVRRVGKDGALQQTTWHWCHKSYSIQTTWACSLGVSS